MRSGDCIDILTALEPGSVDAVVCDPPYGIAFQGERWDGPAIAEAAARNGHQAATAPQAYEAWARLWVAGCLRVLKPGGHLLCFGSPRTAHRLACALEDEGFELRDTLLWLYGTGMPKSRRLPGGLGTALKPAYEPILLARKPPAGSVERTLRLHGTGALNVDACRTPGPDGEPGRYPANVALTHAPDCADEGCAAGCPVAVIDAAATDSRVPSGGTLRPVSRLFYCPKASRRERNGGCEHLPARRLDLFPSASAAGRAPALAPNPHPTVKPLALMRWLVRLATPPGGLVLDPFCGSGSTGCAAVLEHRRFLGIELDPAYIDIARARIAHWHSGVQPLEEAAGARPFATGAAEP